MARCRARTTLPAHCHALNRGRPRGSASQRGIGGADVLRRTRHRRARQCSVFTASTPFTSRWWNTCKTRRATTSVFPDPAHAISWRFPSRWSIARCCSSVNFMLSPNSLAHTELIEMPFRVPSHVQRTTWLADAAFSAETKTCAEYRPGPKPNWAGRRKLSAKSKAKIWVCVSNWLCSRNATTARH